MEPTKQDGYKPFSLIAGAFVLGVSIGVICIQISLDSKFWPRDRHLTTGITYAIVASIIGLVTGILAELKVKEPSERASINTALWSMVALCFLLIIWIPTLWYSARE